MAYIDVFKRYELKFMLTAEQYFSLKEIMLPFVRGDGYGECDVCNLYCDTADFLLARRSVEKPFYKEKLRLRSYGVASADSPVFAEIKKKYDSVVYKRRLVTDEATAVSISKGETVYDSQIGREIAYFSKLYEGIKPRMFISYRREAYCGDGDFRLTFDRNILWRNYDLTLSRGAYGSAVLSDDYVIAEVKTSSAVPMWLVRFLSAEKIYKTSFSKYGRAYIMMQNDDKQGDIKVA